MDEVVTIFRILYAGDDISLCRRGIAISGLLLSTVLMDLNQFEWILVAGMDVRASASRRGWRIYRGEEEEEKYIHKNNTHKIYKTCKTEVHSTCSRTCWHCHHDIVTSPRWRQQSARELPPESDVGTV